MMTQNSDINFAKLVWQPGWHLIVFMFLMFAQTAQAQDLPKGFTYLRDIDTTIVQDIRYYGRHNFLGRKVEGYESRLCILTRAAAIALHNVQDYLLQRKLSLVIYDCYRPMRAVEDITTWVRAPGDSALKREFYPTFDKSQLFSQQFLNRHLSHTRGSSVDVAIVPIPILPIRPFRAGDALKACHGAYGARRRDNALDFGSGFDCFHERSQTDNRGISEAAKKNRKLLLDAMKQEGFVNDSQVWWHFRLQKETYPKTSFDFPINSKGVLDKQGLQRKMRPQLGPVRSAPATRLSRPSKPKPAPGALIYGPVR